jgi:hypothetical protein
MPDVPASLAASLAFVMAKRGEPWYAGDVLEPVKQGGVMQARVVRTGPHGVVLIPLGTWADYCADAEGGQ